MWLGKSHSFGVRHSRSSPIAPRTEKLASLKPAPHRGAAQAPFDEAPGEISPRIPDGSGSESRLTHPFYGEELEERKDQVPVQEIGDPVSQIVFRHLGQAAEEKAGPTHAAASTPNLKCACASGRARLISNQDGFSWAVLQRSA